MTNWFKFTSALVCMGATGIALIDLPRQTTAAELAPAPAAARALPRSAQGSTVTEDDIVTFINAQIRAGWVGDTKETTIGPSPVATDSEWCRRVYLDIIGRLPTVEETEAYLKSGGPNKKLRLISLLMGETLDSNPKDAALAEKYLEEYARNWSTIYSIMLVGRPPANNGNREMVNRDGMLAYLRGSLLRNKPWDKMVEEIVSAQGTTKPGSPEFNGATNFLVNKLQENAAEATAKTAKYFLGIQVQCTQCHNHPFNDWKQDQFWGLNAFFRQTRAVSARDGRAIDYVTLKNQDYAGEGSNPKEAEIYFELRNGELRVAYPTFVDGTKIAKSGYVNEVDRRTELAKLVVKHENFGKAAVNRVWSHFLGYGFTKPVDDMGPHNPVSHPELLDRLGSEFTARGHNLKELIKWITLSEAYSLSSKSTTKNKKDDPSLGEKPKFSHFYLRQMQAEELYESLLAATRAAAEGSAEEQQAKKDAWLRQFTVAFGNDEGDEATTFNGTIPQVLMMMNGDLTKTALASNFMKQLTASQGTLKDKVDYLYMATLSRKPTPQEAQIVLSARQVNEGGVLQDVFWALLNSNEFIFNH